MSSSQIYTSPQVVRHHLTNQSQYTRFKHKIWTQQEKQILIDAHNKYEDDWIKITSFLPQRTPQACSAMLHKLKKKMNPYQKQFTQEEDNKLMKLYEQLNGNWDTISKNFYKKSVYRCKERFSHLKLQNLRKQWSENEIDQLIEEFQNQNGEWQEICKKFSKFTYRECFFKYYDNIRKQTQKRRIVIRKSKKNQMKRKPYNIWTFSDDDLIWKLAKQYQYDWQRISNTFETTRSAIDCKNRYTTLEKIYNNKKNRKWTEEQDRRLLLFGQSLPMKFGYLSKDLSNCTKQDCYLRFRQLMKNNEQLKQKIYKLQYNSKKQLKQLQENSVNRRVKQQINEQQVRINFNYECVIQQLNMLIRLSQSITYDYKYK